MSQAEFWREFDAYLTSRGSELQRQKPDRHAMNFRCAVAGMHITARYSPGAAAGPKAEVELTLPGKRGRELFEALKASGLEGQKKAMGRAVSWKEPPQKSRKGTKAPECGARVGRGINAGNTADWPRIHQWMEEMITKFDNWAATAAETISERYRA